jgi:hypothetical protein
VRAIAGKPKIASQLKSIERTTNLFFASIQLTERISVLEVSSSILIRPSGLVEVSMESLILAQDERWRRA